MTNTERILTPSHWVAKVENPSPPPSPPPAESMALKEESQSDSGMTYRQANLERVRAIENKSRSTPEAKEKAAIYHRAAMNAKRALLKTTNPELQKEKDRKANAVRKSYFAAWNFKNKARRAIASRARYLRLKPQITKAARERRYTDPKYAVACRCRCRLRTAITRQRGGKLTFHTFDLVGCTAAELVKHVESQFIGGMSWERFPEIHLDHIVPIAKFDLTKEDELRAAFHYTNIQPLWKAENLAKNRYDFVNHGTVNRVSRVPASP